METALVEGTLAGSVLEAQRALAALRTGQDLRAAAEALAEAAAGEGCQVLVPAGTDAAAVAGVAAVMSRGMSICTVAEVAHTRARAMVVEAAAVSGLQARRTVDSLRSAGVPWVGLFIWRRLDSGAEGDLGDVDYVGVGRG